VPADGFDRVLNVSLHSLGTLSGCSLREGKVALVDAHFFPSRAPEAFESQEAVGRDAERRMMVEAGPTSTLKFRPTSCLSIW